MNRPVTLYLAAATVAYTASGAGFLFGSLQFFDHPQFSVLRSVPPDVVSPRVWWGLSYALIGLFALAALFARRFEPVRVVAVLAVGLHIVWAGAYFAAWAEGTLLSASVPFIHLFLAVLHLIFATVEEIR